mgnify:CR=1 FL=1
MLTTDLVSIAKIVKPQGNKGEVAADFLTDFPQRFKDLKKVSGISDSLAEKIYHFIRQD